MWGEGTPFSACAPQPWGHGPSDVDASEYSMPYLLATSDCRQLFCTDVVIWSYTTVPVALRLPSVHFYQLGGTGTLFANNQRCRNAVLLRPKALYWILTTDRPAVSLTEQLVWNLLLLLYCSISSIVLSVMFVWTVCFLQCGMNHLWYSI